jgi:hypothetical protein
MFTTILRKLRIMQTPEAKLTLEEIAAQTGSYAPESFLPLYMALDRDPADALRRGLEGVTQTELTEARRKVAIAYQRAIGGEANGGTQAAMVELSRMRNAPPAKPQKELVEKLVAAARAWAKQTPRKSGSQFFATVAADLREIPIGDLRWIESGLLAIACGQATSLPPRPAPPAPVDVDAAMGKVFENAERDRANRERMEENIRAGRGLLDAPEPAATE